MFTELEKKALRLALPKCRENMNEWSCIVIYRTMFFDVCGAESDRPCREETALTEALNKKLRKLGKKWAKEAHDVETGNFGTFVNMVASKLERSPAVMREEWLDYLEEQL